MVISVPVLGLGILVSHLALLLACCVILGKLPTLSVPPCSYV